MMREVFSQVARISGIPSFLTPKIPHQITPKTSVKARGSLSNSPNLVINERKRSSGMFGIGS
jgi:hypothetical protein